MPRTQITSRQNARVKQACALRSRGERERTGRTLVYGVRETARAAAAGATVQQVFVCTDYIRDRDATALAEELESRGAELFDVTRPVFEKLAYGDRHDGLVSVVATRQLGLGDLQLPDVPLMAVVERVEKPGNLGAILRSADGAGLDAVVVVDPVIDLFNPNTIRASVAMVFNKNVVVAAAAETLAWLDANGLAVWAARPDAAHMHHEVDFTRPGAIVLGNEADGLSDAWKHDHVMPLALPMRGVGDSLNVAAAAAVLFYEAERQRTLGGD